MQRAARNRAELGAFWLTEHGHVADQGEVGEEEGDERAVKDIVEHLQYKIGGNVRASTPDSYWCRFVGVWVGQIAHLAPTFILRGVDVEEMIPVRYVME